MICWKLPTCRLDEFFNNQIDNILYFQNKTLDLNIRMNELTEIQQSCRAYGCILFM